MANAELQKLVGELRAKLSAGSVGKFWIEPVPGLTELRIGYGWSINSAKRHNPQAVCELFAAAVNALPALLSALDSQARVCEAAERMRRALYLIDAICLAWDNEDFSDVYSLAHNTHGLCSGPKCVLHAVQMDEIEAALVKANACPSFADAVARRERESTHK